MIYMIMTVRAVSVTAAYRGHGVGEVLEPEAVRGKQSRRAAGDDLADTAVQLAGRGDRLRTKTYQRMLPRKPRTRRVSVRHASNY